MSCTPTKEAIIKQLIVDQDDREQHFEIVKKEGKNVDFLINILKIESQFTQHMLFYIENGWCQEPIPNILEKLLFAYTEELDYYMFNYKGEICFEETQMPTETNSKKTHYQNEGALIALANVSMYNYQHCKMLYQYAAETKSALHCHIAL